MVAIIFTIIITYVVLSLFGHVAHWGLHQPWAGRFNNSHMMHHLKFYPPQDFISEEYRSAGKDSATRFFALASLPFIIAPFVLWFWGILPFGCVIVVLVMEAMMGFLHDYLHTTFHLKNHWLARVPFFHVIFAKWVRLHYLHHVDMSKNFGIFIFHWDRIFKTFWNPDEQLRGPII